MPSFHCCEDQQKNRDEVVKRMVATANWKFAAVVTEKRKINPVLYAPEKFYPRFATSLLRFILKGFMRPDTTQIVVCMDQLLKGAQKTGLIKMIKMECKASAPKVPAWIYCHPRASNKWIQTVDYCGWGLHKKWEKADVRTYDSLRPRLAKDELEITAKGDGTTYY